MSTEMNVDIATFVGEMEDVPCEASHHKSSHPAGPASHYVRGTCPSCGLNEIKAYCQHMIDWIAEDGCMVCRCGRATAASELVVILGPVNK